MPWYGWLILFFAVCIIISPLFSLLKSNKKIDLTAEQKKRIRERNVKWDEMDKKDQP